MQHPEELAYNLDFEMGFISNDPPRWNQSVWQWEEAPPLINMTRAEDSEVMEVVFPHIVFNDNEEVKLPRHRSVTANRVENSSPSMREFVICFLKTLDTVIAPNEGY